jgi:hypothetical protein
MDNAIHLRDTTASAAMALADNRQRQKEAFTQQRRAEDERITGPVMLPSPVDVAIQRIWQNALYALLLLMPSWPKLHTTTLRTMPQLPPTTTLPPPTAMLSTSPRPMSYVGAVLSTLGGSPHAMSLALAPHLDLCLWSMANSR